MPPPRVLIAYKSLPAYRVRFFEELQQALREDGVDLDIVYGNPDRAYQLRGDTRSLRDGIFRRNHILDLGGRRLIWQPVLRRARDYDLVILEQASSLLVNYPLLVMQRLGKFPHVALWGHGGNLQSKAPNGPLEKFKRLYSRLPHWWFAYTDGSARRVTKMGFDPARVTVVQNAIDTSTLRDQVAAVPSGDLSRFRLSTGSTEGDTALFIGSLYPEKRLDFLFEAAALVRERRPAFKLLVAGDGPDRQKVERGAASAEHLEYLGRLDGEARAVALRAADCVLMPGLVGLGILDAFAAEAPMITTAHNIHSPEIEYLLPGENGIIVSEAGNPARYAEAVVDLLTDRTLSTRLQKGCRRAAMKYTNAKMVNNFRAGVHQALAQQ